MGTQLSVIVAASFLMFFRDLLAKIFWSVLIYLCRGEFNHDGNEKTPDEFILLNPNTGSFTHCYIVRYRIYGVKWVFFFEGKAVCKTSNWLEWASSSGSRFPMPLGVDSEDPISVITLLNSK